MGNDEAGTPSKSEKASSPIQEQTNVHAYPDWAAIQAYYPGVSLPPPYFGPPVASGHAPHPYMWGHQPMMPPYGTPYAAIYSHGGVYGHPSMPMGAHPHGNGITSSATTSDSVMATPLSIDTPAKPLGSKDRGLMKKLKSFDGLAVSIGNGITENAAGSAGHRTQSLEGGTESDGSDGNTGNQTSRKRSCEDMAATGKDVNANGHTKASHGGRANASAVPALGVTMAQACVAGKPLGSLPSSGMTPGMDSSASATGKAKSNAANVPPAAVPAREGLSSELWLQDERDLKRERRKQSNRESARRSRLRKQAESEELAMRVESLIVENTALRTEINRLSENSEKLRRENSALMEKLQNTPPQGQGEKASDKIETHGAVPIGFKNLLASVNNSSRSGQQESESRDSSSGKLHQLLESNPRADAVAAG